MDKELAQILLHYKYQHYDYNEAIRRIKQLFTDNNQALQLLQPDVIKSVCSDENLECTDYKTACKKCLNAFYEYKKQTVL
jgi:hypothetical protein